MLLSSGFPTICPVSASYQLLKFSIIPACPPSCVIGFPDPSFQAAPPVVPIFIFPTLELSIVTKTRYEFPACKLFTFEYANTEDCPVPDVPKFNSEPIISGLSVELLE